MDYVARMLHLSLEYTKAMEDAWERSAALPLSPRQRMKLRDQIATIFEKGAGRLLFGASVIR
jgi:hypothetical protein